MALLLALEQMCVAWVVSIVPLLLVIFVFVFCVCPEAVDYFLKFNPSADEALISFPLLYGRS